MTANKKITDSYPDTVHFQKVLHDTVDIAYCEEGTGDKTVLFIHGLGHALTAWKHVMAALKSEYRCIAIDLPGNGLSSKSMSYPYSMTFFARCISDFIQAQQLKNVYLCGHSMGGQIAFLTAAENNTQIKGLFQCAPAGIETFSSWEKTLYQNTMFFVDMFSTEENSLRNAINNSLYSQPDKTQKFIKNLIELMQLHPANHYRYMTEKCISGMLNEPVASLFAEIKIPVFIVFGSKDNLIPNKFIHPGSLKDFVETAIKEFKNATYAIIPQCGHFLQWEKPNEVSHYIDNFLKLN